MSKIVKVALAVAMVIAMLTACGADSGEERGFMAFIESFEGNTMVVLETSLHEQMQLRNEQENVSVLTQALGSRTEEPTNAAAPQPESFRVNNATVYQIINTQAALPVPEFVSVSDFRAFLAEQTEPQVFFIAVRGNTVVSVSQEISAGMFMPSMINTTPDVPEIPTPTAVPGINIE